MTKRRNGLGKFDAPLRVQYSIGYAAFKSAGYHKKVGSKTVFVEHRTKDDMNTMQYREWQRGWNDAYFGKENFYDTLEEQRNEFRGRS